jgi:hypothetical protein
VTRLNDAEVHGEISEDILSTPVQVSVGQSQEDKKWETTPEAEFAMFLDPFLTKHTVGKKNGRCFVTGALSDGVRGKNSVTALYLMGLDVDSGASLDATFATIKKKGLFAVLYTTHSHGTAEIRC